MMMESGEEMAPSPAPGGGPAPPIPSLPGENGPSALDPPPAGLTPTEHSALRRVIELHHTYNVIFPGQCSSVLAQRTAAPAAAVWSVVQRFDRPQVYKHFIRSCVLKGPDGAPTAEIRVGCLRDVVVISGLPASTSTERLDVLDEENRVFGFTIIGGEHRLKNYRSVTTVNEVRDGEGRAWTVVLESYVVDVPEGNTEDDTRLFADTVVRLNLQKLAVVAEGRTASAATSASTNATIAGAPP